MNRVFLISFFLLLTGGICAQQATTGVLTLKEAEQRFLERNFEKLIAGVNENFKKRNISLLEFIDYYDSYKETCIQLHEIKKDVFLAMENLNTTIGQTILNY